jgi:RNA polymerase sigma-70 factor (ECF subfamily)
MDDAASEELRQQFASARDAWPGIVLGFEEFAARAAGTAAPEARDLYLACACGRGDPRAVAEFDRRYLAVTHGAVARIDRSADFIAEVQQVLRERLFAGPNPKINDYRGEGSLVGWVRTAAVRVALNLRRGTPLRTDRTPFLEGLEPALPPELVLIKERCQSELTEALQRAIQALEPADRLLLRLYYVDRLTLAKMATLERSSVSTIYRRLAAITERLLAVVKSDLQARLRLSTDSLDSLIRDAQDSLDLSLHRILNLSAKP